MIDQDKQNKRFADAIVAIAEEVAAHRLAINQYPWSFSATRFSELMKALELDAAQDNLGGCILVVEGE